MRASRAIFRCDPFHAAVSVRYNDWVREVASDQRMGPSGLVMTNDDRLKRSCCSLFRSAHASIGALRPHMGALIVAAVGLAWATNSAGGEPDRNKVDFNFEIRPILADKCFKCHGPDARNRKAGLRLDIKEGAFGTTKSGSRAVVPWQPGRKRAHQPHHVAVMRPRECRRNRWAERSRLERSISSNGGSSKVPTGSRTGRSCPRSRHLLPKVNDPARSRNAIDRFVLGSPGRSRTDARARGRPGTADPTRELRPYGTASDDRRGRLVSGRYGPRCL